MSRGWPINHIIQGLALFPASVQGIIQASTVQEQHTRSSFRGHRIIVGFRMLIKSLKVLTHAGMFKSTL